MKFSLIATTLAATLVAGAAAAEWTHGSAPMGQYEGTYEAPEGDYGINYGCSFSFSQVGFFADGIHVAAGESTVSVDGTEYLAGNTTYNSKWDATSFSNKVQSEWGPKLKDEHNALIEALAAGSEATWTTPSGEVFTFDLTGSSDIRSCKMDG